MKNSVVLNVPAGAFNKFYNITFAWSDEGLSETFFNCQPASPGWHVLLTNVLGVNFSTKAFWIILE
jgi:hypothetical protein